MPTWVNTNFRNISISSNGGSDSTSNDLINLLSSIAQEDLNKHNITNTLANCTTSTALPNIGDDCAYTATILPDSNYDLIAGNVRVIMNGVDITSSCVRIEDNS